MRVLLLIDDTVDLIRAPESNIANLDHPGPAHDVSILLSGLDRRHIQPELCALRGEGAPYQLAARRGWFDISASQRLSRLIHEQHIELIHALGPESMYYATLAGRATQCPILVSHYNQERLLMPDTLLQWIGFLPIRLKRLFQRGLVRFGVDCLVVPSQLVKRDLIRALYPRSQIDVVYQGVELPPLDDPHSADRAAIGLPISGPLATMIAPFTEDEGYDIFFRALPKLRERVPDVKIVIVGDGTLRYELQRRAANAPILWLPDSANIRAIIAASDVIALHPLKERVPRVLMEAAAAAKPVVASRIAGVTEIVQESMTGLLVTLEDYLDFAIQISRVLLQPKFAHSLGQAARKRAEERFSIQAQLDAMTTQYESTIYSSR